jgi:hypothetical protein
MKPFFTSMQSVGTIVGLQLVFLSIQDKFCFADPVTYPADGSAKIRFGGIDLVP